MPSAPIMPARLVASAALCLPLGLAACSQYQAPTFRAVGVREVERSDRQAVLSFMIDARNPNRDPMELGPATYTVTLGGRDVFTGVRSPQSTVHTFSTHTFELPAVIPASVLTGAGGMDYRIRGTVVYKNPGALSDVLFDAEVIVPEASLDLTGTIDLGG